MGFMSKKPDYSDDWMNPRPSSGYTYREPQAGDPKEYLIEREKSVPVFGNPGYITQWDYWAKYDDPEERNKELARLREAHPMWHLRARDRDPYMERLRVRF